MANTKIPSNGIDPQIHNHVINYYGERIKNRVEVLSTCRLSRRVRSAIRCQVSLDKESIRKFRKEGYKRL